MLSWGEEDKVPNYLRFYPEYPECDYYDDPGMARLFGHRLEDPTPGYEYQDLYCQVCHRNADEVIVGLYEWPFEIIKVPILHSAEIFSKFEELVQREEIKRIGFFALPRRIAYLNL